jgi:hypothetical protein
MRKPVPDRKPPNQWQFRKYADVGTSEEFVRQLLELHEILKGTNIFDPEREKVNDALGDIQMEGLLPAFLELRKIRESVAKDLPVLDRLQMYEDLARKLWKSYKDLTQPAARLMGFDIGFLFKNEKNFEVGLKKFRELNPSAPDVFEKFLQDTRVAWQNKLADFRNKIVEHPSAGRGAYKNFYQVEFAEALFNAVWRTIVTILAMLLSVRLPEQFIMVDQGSNDPKREWPNRFRFYLNGVQLP